MRHHPNKDGLVNQTMSTLDVGQVRRVLHEALDVWARSSPLTFQEVYSDQADIQVLFAKKYHGDGYDFDGPGQVLAHAFYPGQGRGGDAHFDEEENWILTNDPNVEGTNLMGVSVHEFGHSLGLGHSSVEDAIMFPWYHGYQMFDNLPKDDWLAIQQLYDSGRKQWDDNPHRKTTTTTPRTTTTTTTTTTRRPYYESDRRHYPHRHNTDPTHRSKYYPHNKPYNPKYNYGHRFYTERPDTENTKRPYKPYPRYPPRDPETTDYPRYYPDRPRTYTTTTSTQRPFRRQPHAQKPETCNTSYDAITVIRGELFIFKDRYLWRIGSQGLYAGYPHEMDRLWIGLPKNFTHIDAVYENKERQIVFFIGNMYYVFNSNVLEKGYPKPLTHLGLPSYLEKIDAALVWGHNNRTYFYSGTLYWRFDEDVKHVELDYPRDMSIWRGIGYHIDAAFQWKNGKTYFFKGKGFWKFEDTIMRVAHDRPLSSAIHWMGCERTEYDVELEPTKRSPLIS
ncbi:Matrix metalloproteinase-2, partial [Pseudolycoriella hygida]